MSFLPAALGIGSSLLNGFLGSSASTKASNQQQQKLYQGIQAIEDAAKGTEQNVGGNVANAQGWATGAAQQANQGIGNAEQQIQALFAPYTSTGTSALSQLSQLAGPNGPLTQQFSFTPQNLQNDPGYQFTLQQGQQALQRSAAARGGLFSGATLKSLAGYTTGTANQYFNDAFNRAATTFGINRQGTLSQIGTLGNLAGMGMSASQATASPLYSGAVTQGANTIGGAQYSGNVGLQGAEYGGNVATSAGLNIAQLLGQVGNAQAGGTLGSAGTWMNAIPGIGYGLQQLSQLYPQGGGGAAPGPIYGTNSTYGPQLPSWWNVSGEPGVDY